ncbi:MAG: isoprenylcysteine carboxylmethyltransferase family protein [Candidatus Bathyarchaeota archaeon]
MFENFGLMMIAMWPAIPMFLIQLHGATDFWKKIGIWTYAVVILEWLPIAYFIYAIQDFFFQFQFEFNIIIAIIGFSFIAAGIVLHSWTAYLLGLKATIGYTELEKVQYSKKDRIITSGPFSIARHPSYWAHTFILFGSFLVSGLSTLAAITIVDILIAYFITMELEEKELVDRFGKEYIEYQKQVPKFFPKIK